jgi:DeoR family transcriptional regulator, ulaG and ulaABCDEF operon transcriptional repressor
MMGPDRRKKLLELVAEHGELSVGQLAQWLPSSLATVRRDIHYLAERSMLKRVHGRALRLDQDIAPKASAPVPGAPTYARQKRAIARHAANLCQDGESIIIHGGSTTLMMAEFLADKKLTALTNSFHLARRLLETTENEVMLTAGTIFRSHDLVLSPFDNGIAPGHRAARTFMGVAGIAEHGLMEADDLLVQAQSRMLDLSGQLVVLADSSKFSRKAGLVLCALDRVASVVTDTGAPDAAVQMLERAGVKVVTVEPDLYFPPLH